MLENQRLVSAVLSIALLISFIVVLYLARGYQIDIRNRQLQGTGILVATSVPDGAMVYINDKAYSATNTSIGSLKPDHYTIKIQKQGYHNWEKQITIETELVTKINALLAPMFPELKPLTFTKTNKPLLSPDGQRIIFAATDNTDNSLWLLEIVERPFNLASRPRELITDTKNRLYSKAQKTWAPNSKDVLLKLKDKNLLLNTTTGLTEEIEDIKKLKNQWKQEIASENNKLIQDLPTELQNIINEHPEAQWSPDQNVILYQIDKDNQTVYKTINLKPARVTKPTQADPTPKPEYEESTVYKSPHEKLVKLIWYPDSKHFIILEKDNLESIQGKLSLIEIDGDNQHEFFSGTIKGDYVFPFTNGSKIVILTSFNPEQEVYNLYSITLH